MVWYAISLLSATLKSGGVDIPIPSNDPDGSHTLTAGLNIAYFIAGAVTVIMIIVAGIQYITANGDTGKTKKATQTISYSIVGLIIVLLAAAITNWILGRI